MAELYPNDLFENAIPMSSFRYLAPSNSEQFEAAIGKRNGLIIGRCEWLPSIQTRVAKELADKRLKAGCRKDMRFLLPKPPKRNKNRVDEHPDQDSNLECRVRSAE